MLHDTYPVFYNFWRPSRYCSSSNHYVLRDSQQFRLISEGVASVPAVYQFFKPGTKIQSDFCPRLFNSLYVGACRHEIIIKVLEQLVNSSFFDHKVLVSPPRYTQMNLFLGGYTLDKSRIAPLLCV